MTSRQRRRARLGRRSAAVLTAVCLVGTLSSCSGDGDDAPGDLLRIDGPAQVDPDVVVGGSSGTDG